MTKKKILVLSDHPLSPSGVGTQTKYFIETMLKTGRYKFVCLGGAMKHEDYKPTAVEPYGDDWIIYPVDGYGSEEVIRSILQQEQPDVLWFMTDPRFYGWLWEMENEVRAVCPMIYYHVWDNKPAPMFNGDFYRSTDEVVCISKVTHEIVQQVAPTVSSRYLPHAVNSDIFKKLKDPESLQKITDVRNQILGEGKINQDKTVFFWNNRNARRKQSGTIIWWFKNFLDEVGHDKAILLMHTDARDPHGQDLPHLIEHLGVNTGQILLSTQKVPAEELAVFYNIADYTINIADAEGFGLATLESLSCGTPIIVNMTGGLQEQVTNGKDWFGWGIQPSSRSVIGSLQVPYIYEDRMNEREFIDTLKKSLNASKKAYKKMSIQGMAHVRENYSFEGFQKSWIETIDEVVEKHGSWDTRKNYKTWQLLEVA
jgi:glycosyltransferase involved in cell wall biosynthesis|tara:strand:+ start:1112 stop:2389 length:1278 start_codon:yes stop_codon:yes gene_type:complete